MRVPWNRRGLRPGALLVGLLAGQATPASVALGAPYVVGRRVVDEIRLDAIDHRLLLLGDAGAANAGREPVLEALRRYAAAIPDRTTVVFLGDIVYETGMPAAAGGAGAEENPDEAASEHRRDAERRVDAQVESARAAGARAVFIPGAGRRWRTRRVTTTACRSSMRRPPGCATAW
jgi:hypothetical protein